MAQDHFGALSVTTEGTIPTYSVGGVVAPAASATDVVTIVGSATKVIRIQKFWFSGTQTTSGVVTCFAIVRNTANTGGTATQPTPVPFDSSDSAATAVVNVYTANPTTGTAVGTISAEKTTFETTAAAAANDHFGFALDSDGIKPVTLRGANQSLSFNLNGVTVTGGSIAFSILWTEEPLQ